MSIIDSGYSIEKRTEVEKLNKICFSSGDRDMQVTSPGMIFRLQIRAIYQKLAYSWAELRQDLPFLYSRFIQIINDENPLHLLIFAI